VRVACVHSDMLHAGGVATAVTLSATVLEALRVMLATLEQPDGSLAATMSGDFATVASVAWRACLAVPIAGAVAWLLAQAAGGDARGARALGSALPSSVWLAALAVGAQATLAAVQAGVLLIRGGQRWYTTAVLVAGGTAGMAVIVRQQARIAREAETRIEKEADVEAGMHDAQVRTTACLVRCDCRHFMY
jgi:hypothetical protein